MESCKRRDPDRPQHSAGHREESLTQEGLDAENGKGGAENLTYVSPLAGLAV